MVERPGRSREDDFIDPTAGLTKPELVIRPMARSFPLKFKAMDKKHKTGSPDKDLTNINEPYRNWADKSGVTHAKLKSDVNAVGNSAKKWKLT